ncbi:MAG: hypothetical protein MUO77_20580, partial [Anaerolineales bacterium]|nr:hypothetical protein [Anaerolineales bacterium]
MNCPNCFFDEKQPDEKEVKKEAFMLRNFISGKLARFATLMLFTFLLAQSSVAREQGNDQQLVEDVATQAAQMLGWGTYEKFETEYGVGILLNHQSDKCPYTTGAVEQITVGAFRDAEEAASGDWPTTFHGYPANDYTESSYDNKKKLNWRMGHYVLMVGTWGCSADNFESITEALYTAAVAHNLGEETPAEPTSIPTPAIRDWDLAIDKIVVLQAVEGGKLVGDWGAGVRVYLSFSGPTPTVFATVELLVDGAVALSYDGRVFQKCPAGYGIACSINFPIPGSILPAGEHTISARAQFVSIQEGIKQMQDPNPANNEKSTGPLTFLPTRSSLTLLMASVDKSIGKEQIVDFLALARPLLADVYPVPGIRIAPAYISLYDPISDMRSSAIELDMYRYTYNSTAWAARQAGQTTEPGADFVVGLYHSGYFGPEMEGVSTMLFRATPLVAVELPEALAHEIGHNYLGGVEE